MESNHRRSSWLTRASLAFFILSTALLIYSSLTTTVVFSKEDLFGLAEKLNIYYWLGLSSVICAAFLQVFGVPDKGSSSQTLFLLEACLLAIYLLAIPAMTEENVYYYDTWQHSSGSMAILAYRTYRQEFNVYASEFPGVFLLGSIVFLVTGIDPIVLMKFYPLFSSVLLVLASYVLFGKLGFSRKMVCLATLFSITAISFVFPRHFSPASIGVIWFLIIFYLSFSKPTRKTMGASMFLALVLIVSHPTTLPFLILSALFIPAAIIVMRFLFKRKGLSLQNAWSTWPFSKIFIVFTVTAWLMWFMFNAPSLLTSLVAMVVNFLNNLGSFLTYGRIASRLGGNPQHLIGQTLKILHTGLHFFVGAVGASVLVFGILKRKKKQDAFLFATLVGWLAACIVLGGAAGFLRAGDLYERLVLYAVVPLSALAVFASRSKHTKVLLILAIIVAAPLSVFAAYSNEYFQYSPTTDSYGSIFMLNHGVTRLEDTVITAPTHRVYRFYLSYWILENGTTPKTRTDKSGVVFVWSQVSENFYSFYLKGMVNETSSIARVAQFQNMKHAVGFNTVYDNGGFQAGFFANITNSVEP